MKKNVLLLLFSVLMVLASCVTPKDIIYFQDAGNYSTFRDIDTFNVYIHQNDNLAILVNSQATEAALPFNLPLANYYVGGESYGQQRMLGYFVDPEGNIDFPVLGKLHVEGLTRVELRDMIKNKLIAEGLLKDPVVTVNFLNFKISVIGEVNRPGNYNITDERVTLLDAISLAGDLTIYGKRDRIAVLREENGRRTILYHDLQSTDIFQSPFYYLQQNDVVYVEPNKRRIQQSNINQNNNVGIWISVVSALVTVTSLILTIRRDGN
ncbi:MAG: polysaccharide export protein [Tannerella sp.]|nr:polysaccharide export protein [Tannerella sp.]